MRSERLLCVRVTPLFVSAGQSAQEVGENAISNRRTCRFGEDEAGRCFFAHRFQDIESKAVQRHAKRFVTVLPCIQLLRPETASRASTAIRAVFDNAEVVPLPHGVTINNPANTRSLPRSGGSVSREKPTSGSPLFTMNKCPKSLLSYTRSIATTSGAPSSSSRFAVGRCAQRNIDFGERLAARSTCRP
jgi:hypothetical protein